MAEKAGTENAMGRIVDIPMKRDWNGTSSGSPEVVGDGVAKAASSATTKSTDDMVAHFRDLVERNKAAGRIARKPSAAELGAYKKPGQAPSFRDSMKSDDSNSPVHISLSALANAIEADIATSELAPLRKPGADSAIAKRAAEAKAEAEALVEKPAYESAKPQAPAKAKDSKADAKAAEKSARRADEKKEDKKPVEAKAAPEKTVAPKSKAENRRSADVKSTPVAKSAPLAGGDNTHSEKDSTKPDFFNLRRSLRYLQFRFEVGTHYTDEIKDEFELLLNAFAQASVQYDAMHQSHLLRRDNFEDLVATRNRQKDMERERNAAQRELEQFKRKLDDKDAQIGKRDDEVKRLRAELDEARKNIASEREAVLAERRKAEETRASTEVARQAAELKEAENNVLREALSEACDTIADSMAARIRYEHIIQQLENDVAELSSEGFREVEDFDRRASALLDEDRDEDDDADYRDVG